MEKSYVKNSKFEKKASGIAPKKLLDTEKALEEIIAKFEEIELSSSNERENTRAIEKERETAVKIRQQ